MTQHLLHSIGQILKWCVTTYVLLCLFVVVVMLGRGLPLEKIITLLPDMILVVSTNYVTWIIVSIPYVIFRIVRYLVRTYKSRGRKLFVRVLSLRFVVPIVLLVSSFYGLRWYNSERGYVYQWDYSVENNEGHTRGLYEIDGKQRGMNLLAIERFEETQLVPLLQNNVEWISLVPFAWQPKPNSPELHLATGGHYYWSEMDSGIVQITTLARARGMHVMVKPHIWLRGLGKGTWRADLAMENEADWELWFENYRNFIIHYAQLAEELGVDLLCIGTELHQTVTKRQDDWRVLIADIRKLYRGKLTYAANWAKELDEVPFWADLDFIGIQAYYPLTDKTNPTVDELEEGWRRHLPSMEKIHAKYQKPILFTEIGFKSTSDAAVRPWEWTGGWSSSLLNKVSTQTQANCYESFFRVLWDKDWFAGAHIWKWYANQEDIRGMTDVDFTPQNKPAQNVMARWYGKPPAN